ncbi:hypothetical protein KCW65_21495, partial [Mycobacterium tuberculosis]|nr:hypothetical protein [Mycobacterium tuberculosis]
AIGLVIEREIMVRVKSKAFMISTLLSIVLFGAAVAASGALPSLFASTDKVAVTSAETVAGIEGIEPVEVAGVEEAKELVRTEAVAAAVGDAVVSLLDIARGEWPASPSSNQLHALTSVPPVICLAGLAG